MNKNAKIAIAACGALLVVAVVAFVVVGSGGADTTASDTTASRPVATAEGSDLGDSATAPRRSTGGSSASPERSSRLTGGQETDDGAEGTQDSTSQLAKKKKNPIKKRSRRRADRSDVDDADEAGAKKKGDVPTASLFDGDN